LATGGATAGNKLLVTTVVGVESALSLELLVVVLLVDVLVVVLLVVLLVDELVVVLLVVLLVAALVVLLAVGRVLVGAEKVVAKPVLFMPIVIARLAILIKAADTCA